ncbi:MAG: isoprenylcysteine carboxylmethyltransferase family protein [Chloroflexi bacterium]|nr:isoprenylcysteine carboxylmethyltransferase family protein [Chloroflexota bacterium]
MSPFYIIFVGLYLASLLTRDAYELLKMRGRIDTTNSRVFAAVFSSMCVMWVSWFGIGLLSPTHLQVPAAVRWVGAGAVILGFVLVFGGMWQLKGVENIDHLVTTGLFSKIRHPMYTGFILLILGWSLWQGAPASLLTGALGLVSIAWWRHWEERELGSRYGGAYSHYRTRTWF